MDPPQVPNSPQTPAISTDEQAASVPTLSVQEQITIQMIHSVSINRGMLYDWHHKIRSTVFPLASGFFVRCRIEDSVDGRALYKLARIKTLRVDWTVELDLLTVDEIKANRNNTNFDCISNTKCTVQEFTTWISKLSPSMLSNVYKTVNMMHERLHLMESLILTEAAFSSKKKDEKKRQQETANEKLVFSNNVLLCETEREIPHSVTILDILNNAIGPRGVAEPDTPRAANATGVTKPRVIEDAVASNSAMVHLADLNNFNNSPPAPPVDASRLLEMIRRSWNPVEQNFVHDKINDLAKLVIFVCGQCREVLSNEPLFAHIQSPVYCFGDIHGNYGDMIYFLNHVIAFDDIMLKYTTSHLLFLGDYVDRGEFSLECVMYLLCLKLINPTKVTMLRGNHESPQVNGDMDVYGFSSFKYQCLDKFGREKGLEVWVAVNEAFQYLPVIADIDKRIFCVHGGLPQYTGGEDRRLEILTDPHFPRISVVQCNDPTNAVQRMMINDLLWSDPAGPNQHVDKYGFGPNPRGPDIKTFGSRAVDMFCERYNYQYIFRAHQEKADGLRISDSARVITIFSTSDYAGHQNGAGCVLVANGKMRMAVKKPQSKVEMERSAQAQLKACAKFSPNTKAVRGGKK